jgi:hypothetical protein
MFLQTYVIDNRNFVLPNISVSYIHLIIKGTFLLSQDQPGSGALQYIDNLA